MKMPNRLTLFALVLALTPAVLSACGDKSKNGSQPAMTVAGSDKSNGGGSSGGSSDATDKPCPKEADIAAAVGYPVRQKPYGIGCYYETPDFGTSVSMMRISLDRTDLLLEQMRGEAKRSGAEVVTINVGERGYAWATTTRGFGFTVAGNQAYMGDLITEKADHGRDKKVDMIRVLKMMFK